MIINLFINITKYGDHNINDVSMNDSPTVKDIKYLKHLYFKENSTSDIIKAIYFMSKKKLIYLYIKCYT